MYMQCSGMQSIYVRLPGSVEIAVGVVVFKASVLN